MKLRSSVPMYWIRHDTDIYPLVSTYYNRLKHNNRLYFTIFYSWYRFLPASYDVLIICIITFIIDCRYYQKPLFFFYSSFFFFLFLLKGLLGKCLLSISHPRDNGLLKILVNNTVMLTFLKILVNNTVMLTWH